MKPAKLLTEDHSLHYSGAASAVLFGPVDRDPTALVQLLVPSDPAFPLPLGLAGHITDRAGSELLVGLEPTAKLAAKRFVLRAVVEIHLFCLLETKLRNRA